MSFLRKLLRVRTQDYKLRALVSSRTLEPLDRFERAVHVFCDLDKTYLETEFESWIKMAKIPFESPHDKITVPGASEVLELVRWGGDPKLGEKPKSALHFVSSSPPQLRLALDGKLTMDRLEWSTDTFKNQTYNIRMGRLDLLRHHIAYKTKAILDIVGRLSPDSRVVMIGDNAEYDSFIYTGIRLFIEKKISKDGLRNWLLGAMVESGVIDQVIPPELTVPDRIAVEGVYIRSVPGYMSTTNSRFAGTWNEFEHWAQLAWALMKKNIISSKSLRVLIRAFHNQHGVPLAHLRWCISKGLERGDINPELRANSDQCLSEMSTLGSSGPSRRMLGWEFDLNRIKDIEAVGTFDARIEAGQWYNSIAKARLDRKQRKN